MFILGPTAGCFVAALTGNFVGLLIPQLAFVSINSYAVVNALFTIFFIRPYRKHFFGLFERTEVFKFVISRLKIKTSTGVSRNGGSRQVSSLVATTSVYSYEPRR